MPAIVLVKFGNTMCSVPYVTILLLMGGVLAFIMKTKLAYWYI